MCMLYLPRELIFPSYSNNIKYTYFAVVKCRSTDGSACLVIAITSNLALMEILVTPAL